MEGETGQGVVRFAGIAGIAGIVLADVREVSVVYIRDTLYKWAEKIPAIPAIPVDSTDVYLTTILNNRLVNVNEAVV